MIKKQIKLLIILVFVITAGLRSLGAPPIPTPTPLHKAQFGKPPQLQSPSLKGQSAPTGDDEDGLRPEGTTKLPSRTVPTTLPGLTNDPCAEKHPIETFVQISSATRPTADGEGGVYFLSDLREVPQLYHLKTPNTWPEQLSFFPDGVKYFSLSPDGQKMLLATHVGGDEQYDIYLLAPGKKTLVPLIVDRTKRVESVAWAPDSSWFAFTSNARDKTNLDLYRYDLKESRATLLSELKGHNSVTDISPNAKWIALTNFRSVTDSDVFLWDIAGKSIREITKHDGEVSNQEGKFSGDSQGFFFLSDREVGTAQIYLTHLTRAMTPKRITPGKWETEEYEIDRNRRQLAYVTNEEGYSRMVGTEIGVDGNFKKLMIFPNPEKAVYGSPSFSTKHTPDGFFFSKTTSTSSSDIWFWKPSRLTQWTHSTQGLISAECFNEEALVHYPSFDRRSIPAFLFLPKGTSGPIPFIVYLHGGPESQYRPGFSRIFQYFLERGYGVFAPNVRGSTGYGHEYATLDNYKNRMDSVKDAVEGAKWLINNRYTRLGQMAVYGGSYGGFMVLRSIEIEPDLFSAASESVGITNFVTFLKNTKPFRRALREAEYGPLSDEAFLKSISPMTYLETIKTPLLIFHGANDPRVPVTETEQIINELKRRSIPVEFKIFPDEGHGNSKLVNIMEQAKLMVYFFEKYIKGKAK